MKKWLAVVLAVLFIAAAAQVALARSKILDLIFENEQPQPQSYTVQLTMTDGKVFTLETTESSFDDVTFEGTMKVVLEDGTYYLNSAQVAYIRVNPAP
ncbi:MAG: hypothetical protein AB1742_13405 [bacterium]